MTFVRRIDAGALLYAVAVSDDLRTWDQTGGAVEPWGDPVPTGDGVTEKATYRLKLDAESAQRKYLRLEVADTEG